MDCGRGTRLHFSSFSVAEDSSSAGTRCSAMTVVTFSNGDVAFSISFPLRTAASASRSSLSETPRPAHPIQLRAVTLASQFVFKKIYRLRVHSRLASTCIASGHRFLVSNRSRSGIVGVIITSRSFSIFFALASLF